MITHSCCGFGHREVFENLSDRISSAVRMAAEHGCKTFYTGAMGRFDEMFSTEVRAIKKNFPNIKLICVMPYMTNEINTQGDYLYTLYDDILVPTELADVHYKAAITKRNQWIIQRSDLVIVYTKRNYGGAYNAKRYAERMNKEIITI